MTPLDKETLARRVEDVEHGDENNKSVHDVILAPIEAVTSAVASEPPAAPVQDGGFRAWLQVLGCFFLVSMRTPWKYEHTNDPSGSTYGATHSHLGLFKISTNRHTFQIQAPQQSHGLAAFNHSF